MAKGQVKKIQMQAQTEEVIFALDIGTRSIIGMVGVIEDEKVKIIAIEKEEHTERAMIDGQIENIEKVSILAGKLKKRLEAKVHFRLNRVCVAAAGRALRTKRAEFEIDLHNKQVITDEIISRLEAGAIGRVEEAFDAENSVEDDTRRFYLVGYTVCQYFLDDYRISSLKDHRGRNVKVDLIATFLPSEVVESLYTTMNKIGLEVVSVTLEPIAAINAAIPENLRLLNLVMVDIGAGTSDIAACTGGSVTGNTMATVAGDEITEKIMQEYLVDFASAESMKAQIEKEEVVTFTDILGFERKASREEVLQCIQGTVDMLCKEIAGKVLEVNGNAPSALFLAGGGSKLAGLKEGITAALQMDANRVAVAGNNFRISAFSEEYDLNNPEYATPLGITISSGLNLINDSFRVTLNGRPAKLFRSGTFTALNLLMMNGYHFQDVMGRPGSSLSVTVNGKRKAFYGTAARPASLFINKKEGKLSTVINAGDCIDFVPAVPGIPAEVYLGDIEGAMECEEITLNGKDMPLETLLKVGDVIRIRMPREEETSEKGAGAEDAVKEESEPAREEDTGEKDVREEDAVKEEPESARAKDAGAEDAVKKEPGSARTPARLNHERKEPARVSEKTDADITRQYDAEEGDKGTRDAAGVNAAGRTAVEPPDADILAAGGSDVKIQTTGNPDIGKPDVETAGVSVQMPETAKETGMGDMALPDTGSADIDEYIEYKDRAAGDEQLVLKFGMDEDEPADMPVRKAGADIVPDIPVRKAGADIVPDILVGTKAAAEPVSGGPARSPVRTRPAGTPAHTRPKIVFQLNGSPIRLPRKEDGGVYYLMDLLQYSGIDLHHPKGTINLLVNGEPGMFQQKLSEGDVIVIEETKI